MKEKQIEEMGMSGYSKFAWKLWAVTKLPMTQCLQIEEIVKEQGYRKQSEVIDEFANEMKQMLDDYYATGEDALIDTCELIDYIATKMKGGEGR